MGAPRGFRRLAAAVALVTASCGGGPVTPVAPTAAADTASNSVGFSLPIDRYLPLRDPVTRSRYNTAIDQLLEDCAGRNGVDLVFPARPEPDRGVHSRRYGVDRVEDAATSGFEKPRDSRAEALRAFDQSLSDAQLDVLYGTDNDTGCIEQIQPLIAGGDPRWQTFAAAEGLVNSTLLSALDHPLLAGPLAEWRSCMLQQTGLTADHPMDFAAAVTEDTELPHQSLALADLACKAESDLVTAWAAAESLMQEEVIEANVDLLEEALSVQIHAIQLTDSVMSKD